MKMKWGGTPSRLFSLRLRAFVCIRNSPEMEDSHEATKAPRDQEEIGSILVDSAFRLHRDLGPGLLEAVYEVVLAKMLRDGGLEVERQKVVPIEYAGLAFEEGFRADLIIEGSVLVELKSVENLAPVHFKQTLTYLRLLKLPLGFLINFGAATFKEGCKRIVNGSQPFASSCLRVHQKQPRDGRLTRSHQGTKG
jgi:iron complex transport system substrate-binding protein